MGFFDLFRRNKRSSNSANANRASSKEDIFRELLQQLAQSSPSAHFASGAVFDIVRQQHGEFAQIVRSNNASGLHLFFANAYIAFCRNPDMVGFTPNMVNGNNNDTDPRVWNADIFPFENGDAAALCYMPVQDDALAARIIGIILSDRGDRYYYCMLNKNESLPSDVMRNKALDGIEKVGAVRGRGFELMQNFLNCIK